MRDDEDERDDSFSAHDERWMSLAERAEERRAVEMLSRRDARRDHADDAPPAGDHYSDKTGHHARSVVAKNGLKPRARFERNGEIDGLNYERHAVQTTLAQIESVTRRDRYEQAVKDGLLQPNATFSGDVETDSYSQRASVDSYDPMAVEKLAKSKKAVSTAKTEEGSRQTRDRPSVKPNVSRGGRR